MPQIYLSMINATLLVTEDTFAVTVGLEKQAKSGIAEALAPQIVS